ncbi:hypothetical protein [Mesorhizobium sp. WSM4904]|uniref:hypothetical protein n=1 Tax=Mesorhizobium sp. WSM4904 TaxID=3038545 RepID=UPI0024188F58|nr:hypothetical protein [Mesorhizobium sp. WSM4904]WFP62359.1 hypothetical protein QAZ47_28565 [Mesorhizobium sp. WSM4904]
MSFEAYLACFEDGQEGYFPTAVVDEAFAPFITSRDGDVWTVTYRDAPLDQTELYMNLNPEDYAQCSGLTVVRPTTNTLLYDSLLKILRGTNSCVYFPGDCPPLVARAETIPHLNQDMIETLGEPLVVLSGTEISDRLGNS